jgi:small subunit ribosomal protein S19
MSRSLKKGPYIAVSLEKKVLAMNESGKKNVEEDLGPKARCNI